LVPKNRFKQRFMVINFNTIKLNS